MQSFEITETPTIQISYTSIYKTNAKLSISISVIPLYTYLVIISDIVSMSNAIDIG